MDYWLVLDFVHLALNLSVMDGTTYVLSRSKVSLPPCCKEVEDNGEELATESMLVISLTLSYYYYYSFSFRLTDIFPNPFP